LERSQISLSELTILKKSQNMPVSLTEKSDSPKLKILQMQEYISSNHGNLISIQAQVLKTVLKYEGECHNIPAMTRKMG
jgi:hypothetical protein